ncbi:MAG: 3'-5' exonuclease [Oscillospiraceae bacterium]|nr:3'-5' exonuclease [Oscillospiraceae bacterium]
MGFLDAMIMRTPEDKKRKEFLLELQSIPAIEGVCDGKYHKRNYAKRDLADFKCKQLTKSTPLKKLSSFVAFDTETTGIQLTNNEVIEVSLIKFVSFKPVMLFTTLIKPSVPIPPEVTKINHITEEMVEFAPKFYQIIPILDWFVGKLPMVAHNAPFDVMHLYASGLDSMAKRSVYDTCEISRKSCKQLPDHKLATSCAHYGIYFDGAHNASEDALACGKLFVQMIMEKNECQTIQELQRKLS